MGHMTHEIEMIFHENPDSAVIHDSFVSGRGILQQQRAQTACNYALVMAVLTLPVSGDIDSQPTLSSIQTGRF